MWGLVTSTHLKWGNDGGSIEVHSTNSTRFYPSIISQLYPHLSMVNTPYRTTPIFGSEVSPTNRCHHRRLHLIHHVRLHLSKRGSGLGNRWKIVGCLKKKRIE